MADQYFTGGFRFRPTSKHSNLLDWPEEKGLGGSSGSVIIYVAFLFAKLKVHFALRAISLCVSAWITSFVSCPRTDLSRSYLNGVLFFSEHFSACCLSPHRFCRRPLTSFTMLRLMKEIHMTPTGIPENIWGRWLILCNDLSLPWYFHTLLHAT